MAASAQDMNSMTAGGPQATGAAGTPPTAPPAPAAQPTPQAGNAMLAQVHIQTGMKMLQSGLAMSQMGTKEYGALLEVLKKLNSTFGASTEAQSLVPAEVLQMARAVQQQGSAPINPQQ